jgi:hypothetical protein
MAGGVGGIAAAINQAEQMLEQAAKQSDPNNAYSMQQNAERITSDAASSLEENIKAHIEVADKLFVASINQEPNVRKNMLDEAEQTMHTAHREAAALTSQSAKQGVQQLESNFFIHAYKVTKDQVKDQVVRARIEEELAKLQNWMREPQ